MVNIRDFVDSSSRTLTNSSQTASHNPLNIISFLTELALFTNVLDVLSVCNRNELHLSHFAVAKLTSFGMYLVVVSAKSRPSVVHLNPSDSHVTQQRTSISN